MMMRLFKGDAEGGRHWFGSGSELIRRGQGCSFLAVRWQWDSWAYLLWLSLKSLALCG